MFGDWFLGSVFFHCFFFVPWDSSPFNTKSGEIFLDFFEASKVRKSKIVDVLLLM